MGFRFRIFIIVLISMSAGILLSFVLTSNDDFSLALIIFSLLIVATLASMIFANLSYMSIYNLEALASKIAKGRTKKRYIKALKNEPGEFRKVAKSISEISENLKDKINLIAKQRDQFGSVLDDLGEGVVVTDKEGNITFENDQFSQILNLKTVEGQNIKDLGYQGLAFAIPINVALDVTDQIIKNGEVSRGYLGVRMSEVDSDLADALGMNKPYGALINDVEEGESADNAGLLPGDVIIEFDSKEIKFSSDLPHVVGQIKPDSRSRAKVIRDGKEITLDFVLGELPITSEQFIPAKTQQSSDPLGLKVADIDRDNPSMTNMPEGVIVSRINPNSAASGKVYRGDVITMIQYQGQKYMIYDVDSFNQALSNFSSNNKIAIHLIRNGTRLIRPIRLN